MTLIYDKRDELDGRPGLHALIAGVSYYDHLPGGNGGEAENTFGMEQLSSPAISAYTIYQWLLENKSRLPVDLATIRILLSPSEEEINVEPKLQDFRQNPCTRDNFENEVSDWREDARTHKDGFTFFYFCGHGVQRRTDDAVILFEDFGKHGKPILSRTATIDNIYYGMAPPVNPTLTIAQSQLYLVDTCRIRPEQFNSTDWLEVPPIFDTRSGVDDRTSPVFYASIPGTEANGRNAQMSFFSEALLNCLNGNGGDYLLDKDGIHRWQVKSLNLNRALEIELKELNKKYNTTQDYDTGGRQTDMIINYLDSAPDVEILLEIDPSNALPYFKLKLTDMSQEINTIQIPPPLSLPQKITLKSGFYKIEAQIQDPPKHPYKDKQEPHQFLPLDRFKKVRVL